MKFHSLQRENASPASEAPDSHAAVAQVPLWRRAFRAPVIAALRLHQYRNLHSAMVYEALCELDRCDQP